MQLTPKLLIEILKIVEYGTGRPANMATDEEWTIAIEIILAEEQKKRNQ